MTKAQYKRYCHHYRLADRLRADADMRGDDVAERNAAAMQLAWSRLLPPDERVVTFTLDGERYPFRAPSEDIESGLRKQYKLN